MKLKKIPKINHLGYGQNNSYPETVIKKNMGVLLQNYHINTILRTINIL